MTAGVEGSGIWRLVDRRGGAIAVLSLGEVPLYLVHPIAGDVSCYAGLAAALGPRVSTRGVQTPRALIDPVHAASIEAMAEVRAQAVLAHAGPGALCLGGWSAGAILALEVARRVRAAGRTVPLLVAIDGAPCGAAPPQGPARAALGIAAKLPGWGLDKVLQRRRTGRWRFPEGVAGDGTIDAAAIGGVVAATRWSPGQEAFVRAFHAAAAAHVAAPYDGAVLSIEARVGRALRPRRVGEAWEALCPRVERVGIRANHLGLLTQPRLEEVADHVRRAVVVAWDGSRAAERGGMDGRR